MIHFPIQIIMLQGALSLAELGTIVPESGGEYAYLLKAFGPLPAFLFAWMFVILLRPASVAIMALTCAKYIIVPAFEGSCEEVDIGDPKIQRLFLHVFGFDTQGSVRHE